MKAYLICLIALFCLHSVVNAKEITETYENGETKSISEYVDGKLVVQKKYSLKGLLTYELRFDEEGNKYEIQRSYYDDERPLKIRPLKNNLTHGLEKEYYRNGHLRAIRHYIAGKKEGVAQGFYENGRLQGDWLFEAGEPISAEIHYMTGGVHLKHRFENGKKNGLTKEYDKNGKLMAKRYYKNDKMIKRKRVR